MFRSIILTIPDSTTNYYMYLLYLFSGQLSQHTKQICSPIKQQIVLSN